VDAENEDEEEDKDENDGKEPWTIGQGEMINTWADDAHTMVAAETIVPHEQGWEMRKQTPRPQPLAPAPHPQTPEPPPRLQTLEIHTLNGLEVMGLVTLQ
jgi:hypothetical protein